MNKASNTLLFKLNNTIITTIVIIIIITITLTSVSSAATTGCSYAGREKWVNKGTCRQLYISGRYNAPDSFINLLSTTNVPDMLDDAAATLNAKEFRMTATPPLYYEPTVDVGTSTLFEAERTKSTLRLTGVAPPSVYRAVIDTIQVRTSPEPTVGAYRVFHFLWELMPVGDRVVAINDAETSEPHYYYYFPTDAVSWDSAVSKCNSLLLFGLRGYLVVVDGDEERVEIKAKIGSYSFWIGASRDGTWVVGTGPKAGQAAYTIWAGGFPAYYYDTQAKFVFMENGLMKTRQGSDPLNYVCEFGGWRTEHPQGKNLRGAVRLTTLASACDFGPRANWAYPGTCSQQTATTRVSLVETKKLFTEGYMPDMVSLTGSSVQVREFEMTVTPALCEVPTVQLSSGIGKMEATASSLVLGNKIASFGNYATVVKTITVSNCNKAYPSEATYDVLWQFKPEVGKEHAGLHDEPHYYVLSSEKKKSDDAYALCRQTSLWGLPGYLATLTSKAETSRVLEFPDTYWVGGQSLRSSMWWWSDGPEAETSLFSTQWSGQWATSAGAEPNNSGKSALEANWGLDFHGGLWETLLKFVCEYGGTEGSLGFRGAIRLTMSQVACDVPDSRRYYDFPGVCHVAFDAQLPGATKTRTLFTPDVVPDLMVEDNTKAVRFTVVNSGLLAMCAPFDVVTPTADTGISISGNTATNGLTLSGVAAVVTYNTIVRSITFTTCPRHGDVTDEYTFTWAYEPDLPAMYTASNRNGEPHYYWVSMTAEKDTFTASLAKCGVVFGLNGYLATVTEQAENNVINSLHGTGYLGARNPFYSANVYNFYWVQGPESGQSLSTYSNFDSTGSQPNGNVANRYYNVIMWQQGYENMNTIVSGKWDDRDDVSHTDPYICEYGGSGYASKAFRGITRFDIRTSPCDYTSHDTHKWAAKGLCRVNRVAQSVGSSAPVQSVFPPQLLDDEFTTESTIGVNAYGVTVVGKAMCGRFSLTSGATLPSGATLSRDTPTEYRVTHTAPATTTVAAVKTLFSHLHFSPCSRPFDGMDTYSIRWYLEPALHTVADLHTGEPNYYSERKAASGIAWKELLQTCETATVFGLNGYLGQPVDVSSNDALKTSGSHTVTSISDIRHKNAFMFYSGPRAGSFITAFSKWSLIEPTHCQGCPSLSRMQNVVIVRSSSEWDDVEDVLPSGVQYLCQFGGLPVDGNKEFRGIIHVEVISSWCRSPSASKFTGACHTVDVHHTASLTATTHKLFTPDAVPDLIKTDANYDAKEFTLHISPALCTQ
eukprot:PhM_4_TR11667/c0_g4_i1/m.64139